MRKCPATRNKTYVSDEQKNSPAKHSALIRTSMGGTSFGSFLGLLVSTFDGGFVFLFLWFLFGLRGDQRCLSRVQNPKHLHPFYTTVNNSFPTKFYNPVVGLYFLYKGQSKNHLQTKHFLSQ